MVVITISGPHGAGKSTYAKAIADALNLKYVSSGQTFRKLAKESDCDLETFSKQCEKNKEIDKKIDQLTIEEAKTGNVILEGQLAAWMAQQFSNFNIYITASLDTRVKRIAERDGTDYKKAKKETINRTNSEIKRFQKMYDLNVQQKHIYDLILNTDRLPIEKCTEILIAACRLID